MTVPPQTDKTKILVDGKYVSLSKLAEIANDARIVDARDCTGLTALPDLTNAEYVDVSGCTGLTALPDLPNARTVDARGCTGGARDPFFRYLCAGCDSRGYLFEAMRISRQWRVVAGCRNFNFEDARSHWGKGGKSDRQDCLALVEKLIAEATRIEAAG